MKIIQSLGTVCLALFVGQGWAADSTRAKSSAGASAQDQEFVQKAAQGGLAEVVAGKLASAKASNSEVKRFGTQMVTDHGKANAELANIAKSKGITVPTEPDAAHQQLAKRLEATKGADFDRLYIEEAGIKDHKDAVDLFTRQANSGQDAELKAFAAKTLPTIKHHLEMVQAIAAKIK
jgi:putative membrane protein